jgi:hypothetical protein
LSIYDQDTGEVIKRDNYALLSNNDLIALSEHILDVTLDMLANDPALDTSVDERSKVRAIEEILVTQLRGRDVQLEVANNVVEARLRLECRLGATIPRGQDEGWLAKPGDNRATKSLPDGRSKDTLLNYQISHKQSSVWQKFARHEALLDDYALTCKEEGRPMSGEGFLRFAENGLANHQLINQSLSPEWYTPSEYVEAGRRVMGGFDIDPASCAQANETIRATTYYTKETNGLDKDWIGRCWLNPPYGALTPKFTARLEDQYQSGNVTEAIAVLSSNSLITAWFTPLWQYIICFPRRRINFENPDGMAASATHGTVFVYLGHQEQRFYNEFKEFGYIVKQVDPYSFPYD